MTRGTVAMRDCPASGAADVLHDPLTAVAAVMLESVSRLESPLPRSTDRALPAAC
jgi:hypothetical protein